MEVQMLNYHLRTYPGSLKEPSTVMSLQRGKSYPHQPLSCAVGSPPEGAGKYSTSQRVSVYFQPRVTAHLSGVFKNFSSRSSSLCPSVRFHCPFDI